MKRNLFFSIIGIFLVLSFLGDLSVYRQSQIETASGKFVEHSYEELQTIGAVKTGILEMRLRKKPFAELEKSIKALISITQNSPLIRTDAEKLLRVNEAYFWQASPDYSMDAIEKMFTTERATLVERQDLVNESNVESLNRILYANLVDILLIIIALAFYLYERKQATAMQSAMNRALAQVEAVNQNLKFKIAKDDSKFKTAVHDLKNPLGSILGFAELLKDGTRDQNSVLNMAQIIQRVSNSTLELVGSVLNSEPEVNDEKSEQSMLKILKEICVFLEPVAYQKGQVITLDRKSSDFSFVTKKLVLQNIFYNIVGNALKFSPVKTEVIITCQTIYSGYRIEIKDQGPGFSEDDFKNLFQQGARLSATPTGNEVSTGLGLYSVKETLSEMGGQIEVTNNPGGGACIAISFKS